MVVNSISENNASIVNTGEYGTISAIDITKMGYYIVKFISDTRIKTGRTWSQICIFNNYLTSMYLSISTSEPGTKSEISGVMWQVAPESKIQLVSCNLSPKSLLGLSYVQ